MRDYLVSFSEVWEDGFNSGDVLYIKIEVSAFSVQEAIRKARSQIDVPADVDLNLEVSDVGLT